MGIKWYKFKNLFKSKDQIELETRMKFNQTKRSFAKYSQELEGNIKSFTKMARDAELSGNHANALSCVKFVQKLQRTQVKVQGLVQHFEMTRSMQQMASVMSKFMHTCAEMGFNIDSNIDLKSMMKLGYHFSNDELVKWWNQMVQALNYTHKMGIVHRDIKPSNIFIDNQGNVKLLDFGIAKNDDNAANTLTGSTMGTLLYMSPEQVKDPKRVTCKTDFYSLAVTFVHLVTGKAPYDSTNSSNFEIQMNIVRKPLDISQVTPTWRAFLGPYLDKDPKNRPELTVFDGEKFCTPRKYPLFIDPSDPAENSNPYIPIPDETVFDDAQSSVKKNGDELALTVNGVSFVMKKVEGDLKNMEIEKTV